MCACGRVSDRARGDTGSMKRGPHRWKDRRGGSEQRVLGARETPREDLCEHRGEAESERSPVGVGAHRRPGLVTDEGERKEKSQQTEGRGERRREAPLGWFPRWL